MSPTVDSVVRSMDKIGLNLLEFLAVSFNPHLLGDRLMAGRQSLDLSI